MSRTLHRRATTGAHAVILAGALMLPAGRTARTASAAPAASAAATVATSPIDARSFHLRLEKSAPSDGEALATSPGVIRLWFSLPPELAVTSIRLADANGTAIALSAPRRGAGDKDPVEATVASSLAAGKYVVSWRTSSKDGHPIKGTFAFSVKGATNRDH